ncbi:MAG: cytochrome c [Saprospiraceae bacterium]|nr:cytochrome c [Saprospiraceae bacterium]
MKKVLLFLIYSISFSFSTYGQSTLLNESIKRGKEVYSDFCINCHLGNGEGTKGIIPPLAKSDYLLKKREESIRAVKYGQKGEITVNGVKYNGIMTNQKLSEEEVADVMNYILNTWGNKDKNMVTVEEVNSIVP